MRLTYNNGETLSYWWLNSYVGFDSVQRSQVRPQIDALFDWHRETQLPDYAQLLGEVQRDLQSDLTPTIATARYAAMKKRAVIMFDQALPALADLSLSLDAEQIVTIEKKFASNAESYRKDYLRGDIEERQQFRFKKAMKQAEYWFGDFTREQEAQLRRVSDARPLNNELVGLDRTRRQRILIALLKKIRTEKPARDVAMRWLKEHVSAQYEHTARSENAAFFEASTEGAVGLVVAMANLSTPQQKAHAVRKIQDVQKMLADLAVAAS
ncbi:DUF6279 family lipoprotein [Actimicrobium antarcticum]|uniref:Uncharacterized protein n=1 Tax=Actimicrobium antarcticum TaxID=1051899 RepID=A0ABP7TY28_9BURK